MKHLISCLAVSLAVSAFAVPTLTDVDVIESGNRIVTISYKLANEPAVVTVDIQTNDTATGAWASIGGENVYPALSGDCSRVIENGNSVRTIFWKPVKSWPGHFFKNGTAKAVLTAWPTNAPPTFMVVDLKDNAGRIAYYPDKRSIPGGISNYAYKSSKILLRKIPAAGVKWQMGSPTSETQRQSNETLHNVTLTEDYYMAVYETTKGQYEAVQAYGQKQHGTFVGFSGAALYSGGTEEEKQSSPVNRIDYYRLRGSDGTKYNWPTDKHDVDGNAFFGCLRELTGGMLFDLPTEAQWEYAARSGTSTPAYFGYSLDYQWGISAIAKNYCWYRTVSTAPRPVGMLISNAFDLYDVLGNVQEACLDPYVADLGSDDVVNPKPSVEGESTPNRVFRGASVGEGEQYHLRSAHRVSKAQQTDSNLYGGSADLGFRIWAPAVAVKQ